MSHWLLVSVMVILSISPVYGVDLEKMKPKPEDIERVQKLEQSLKKPEYIEKAKQYEHLKDRVDMNKTQSAIQPQLDNQNILNNQVISQPDKQKYIFYLFSKSIPDTAIESVFIQSKKLNVNFYGVLRGIDKEGAVLEKIKGIKGFEDITIKVNPLIFNAVGAKVVPAIVYAYCPQPQMFSSSDCDYKYIVYGDLTLMGALEIMGRHDSETQRLYEELKNAF